MITLDEIKAHVRVWHDLEDTYLLHLLDTAIDHIERITNRTFTGTSPEPLPPSARHAALLLVGHWYEQRQDASDKPLTSIPKGVDALLFPLRRNLLGVR